MRLKLIGAVLVVLALLIGVYFAWPLVRNAMSTSPNTESPPGTGAGVSGGAPLAAEREDLSKKFTELDKAIKEIPVKRKAAFTKGPKQEEAQTDYEGLLNSLPGKSEALAKSLGTLNESAGKLEVDGDAQQQPKLSPELAQLESQLAVKIDSWSLPLLVLSSLLLLGFALQFAWSISQSRALGQTTTGLPGMSEPIGKLRGDISLISEEVKRASSTLAKVHGSVNEVLSKIEVNTHQLEEGGEQSLEQNFIALEQNRAKDAGGQQSRQPEPPTPDYRFPGYASEYLEQVKDVAPKMKPDYQSQNTVLVEDPDGLFLLVKDKNASDGTSYVIPFLANFRSKQDFYNNYTSYYDCYNPSSGRVWIQNPARVEKVAEGWSLAGEKGMLEVKQQ
jgi:hypothetical protein